MTMTDAEDLAAPVATQWGATDDPAAPLVVLLHGRGATEHSMVALRRYLPAGPAYAALRAPLPEGGGFAWFANSGIGRPRPESLAATMAWFRSWLDDRTAPEQPVVLIGFSGGAAFAGGLLLANPYRFAAGGLLYGTLPFDAGVTVTPGRLVGVPIFLVHGAHDTVIPTELQQRTWEYLTKHSGAPLWADRAATGHELTAPTVAALGQWIAERLAFVQRHPAAGLAGASGSRPRWATLPGGRLPQRRGERPEVSVATPQQQQSQNAPTHVQEALFEQVIKLDGVTSDASAISVPGARALVLDPDRAGGDEDAFIVPAAREFAHLHPAYDGSLHLVLPAVLAADALRAGWALAHPLAGIRLAAGMVMIYGPRDEQELEIVAGIVRASHAFARGTSADL